MAAALADAAAGIRALLGRREPDAVLQLGIGHATDRVARVSWLLDDVAGKISALCAPGSGARLSAGEVGQLRELALSLVAWDRLLFNFIVDRLQHAGITPPRAGEALSEAVARLTRLSGAVQAKLVPPGGLNSLLYHVCSSLEDVRAGVQALLAAQSGASAWFAAWRWAYPLATAALLVAIHARRLRTGGVQWRLRSTLGIGVLSILLYRRLRWAEDGAAALAGAHRQLQLLMRLWVLTLDQFTTTNVMGGARAKSYALNIADLQAAAHLAEDVGGAVPVRRMLMHTSLPSDAAIWCTKNWRLAALKRGLDLTYAAVAEGYALRGGRWAALQLPVTLAAAAYYAWRPEEAAEAATSALQQCDVGFVSLVWNAVNSPTLLPITQLLTDDVPADRTLPLPAGGSVTVLVGKPLPDAWWDAPTPRRLFHPPMPDDGVDLAPAAVLPAAAHAGRRSYNARVAALKRAGAQADEGDSDGSAGGGAAGTGCGTVLEAGEVEDGGSGGALQRLTPTGQEGVRVMETSRALHGGEVEEYRLCVEGDDAALWRGTQLRRETSAIIAAVPLPDSDEEGSAATGEGAEEEPGVEPGADATTEEAVSATAEDTVLLYVHGGGFVASSYAVDRLRVAKWANSAGFAVAYMHYTLAPEARHPVALNQCMQAYCWLRARFGRVVLFGDSAGGNFVAALTLRCVATGLPLPDTLILAYPALNLNIAPGPSRALHLNDPLVPKNLLTPVADAYVPQPLRGKAHGNPYLSPVLAADGALAAFPPTHVVVGGLDPLLDDSIDFVTRLRRLGVQGDMKVYRSLPHGFFSFDFLPLADQAIADVERWTLK